MRIRFCPSCRGDVADVGGYCLLGHRLSVSAETGSLSELRAEVDRAFEEARMHVSGVLGALGAGAPRPAAPPPSSLAPPPPPPARVTPRAEATDGAPAVRGASGAPLPLPGQGPPRRPSPEALYPACGGVYQALEARHDESHDPITAFAPAPRMDWGPVRSLGRRRQHA